MLNKNQGWGVDCSSVVILCTQGGKKVAQMAECDSFLQLLLFVRNTKGLSMSEYTVLPKIGHF